jgi:hypothetical protein
MCAMWQLFGDAPRGILSIAPWHAASRPSPLNIRCLQDTVHKCPSCQGEICTVPYLDLDGF